MTTVTEQARWTYVGAYALCVDGADQLLLCRVAPGYNAAGQWTLPGGGLDFGEAPEVGVIRELAEETGLVGEVDGLAFVDSGTGPPGTERGTAYGPYHAIRIVYRVKVTGGVLSYELEGSTDVARWISRREAAELPLVGLARVALDYLDGP
jgi:8-oxo-dGTP diphosphatase